MSVFSILLLVLTQTDGVFVCKFGAVNDVVIRYPPPPNVHFICTKTLADDFNKVVKHLHLPEKMQAHSDIHSSSSNSNAAALGGGKGVDSRLVPSDTNKAWIEEMYAGDIRVYKKYCPD